jgi:hypothetical protein
VVPCKEGFMRVSCGIDNLNNGILFKISFKHLVDCVGCCFFKNFISFLQDPFEYVLNIKSNMVVTKLMRPKNCVPYDWGYEEETGV